MPVSEKRVKAINRKTSAFCSNYSPIGLDLGSSMIKVIQFHNQRGKLSVNKGFIGRTPEGAFEGGELVSPDLLARKIKAVISEKGWQVNSINLGLGSQAFSFRTVRLPVMDNRALNKAMYWEALQSLPQAEEEIVFDYCLQNKCSETDHTRNYILAATSKNIAERYTGILDLAGFKCSALEIEPLSLFRSFNMANPGQLSQKVINPEKADNRSKPVVLIHIGYCNSTVLVTGKDELFYHRSFKLGAYNFIRTLQDKNMCSTRDAEKLLFSNAATLSNELLFPTCKQMALKIEQTLNTWLDQCGQAEPALQQLYFCGGGALIPGLRSLIEKHLQIKQTIYNPLIKTSLTGSADNNYQNREDIFFSVAHGLALRGWSN